MKYLLVVSLFFFYVAVFAQRDVISECENYTYSIGSDTISDNWKLPSYDDGAWNPGRKIIGYGYKYDSTAVDTCVSIFMRIPFMVNQLDSVLMAVLSVEYDDGFVAYINGVEVLRKNLGVDDTNVPYNQLADRSHDALTMRYREEQYLYLIDSFLLRKSLIVGENILAIQVHNDSVKGEDITFAARFLNRTYRSFNPYDETWRALTRIDLDSTQLPIIIMNTLDDTGFRGKRTMVQLSIIDNKSGFNKPTDTPNIYNEWANCEVRGQSSADWVKKSFNVELKDLLGVTQDVSLFGMAKDNDWVLAANYTDRSHIRNKLIYTLADGLNTTAPQSQFVEVILNDDYLGLYQFLEKPKRGKHRIDVEKQATLSDTAITGGYIFKFDKPSNSPKSEYSPFRHRGIDMFVTYPEYADLSMTQLDYIDDFWDGIVNSTNDSLLLDSLVGYRNFIDIDSYIDFTLINELCRNSDGMRYSTFMHKPANDKLHFGPLWDFDLSFGNSKAQNGYKTEGWLFSQYSNSVLMQQSFFKDTALVRQFSKRYRALRTSIFSEDHILNLIDNLSAEVEDASVRNYKAWQYNSNPMESWIGTPSESIDVDSDLKYMKQWILTRLLWMDENIDQIYYKYTEPITEPIVLTSTGEQSEVAYLYNAETKELSLQMLDESEVYVFNTAGQLVFVDRVNTNLHLNTLISGIYFITIKTKHRIETITLPVY